MIRERPEPIQMYFFTDFQCQTGHDETGAESHLFKALGTPEGIQPLEVLRVEIDGSGGGFKVFNGVCSTQGNCSVEAVRKGRKKEQGAAVDLQVRHKGTPPTH